MAASPINQPKTSVADAEAIVLESVTARLKEIESTIGTLEDEADELRSVQQVLERRVLIGNPTRVPGVLMNAVSIGAAPRRRPRTRRMPAPTAANTIGGILNREPKPMLTVAEIIELLPQMLPNTIRFTLHEGVRKKRWEKTDDRPVRFHAKGANL